MILQPYRAVYFPGIDGPGIMPGSVLCRSRSYGAVHFTEVDGPGIIPGMCFLMVMDLVIITYNILCEGWLVKGV